MLNEFRNAYPKGSLISELLNIYQGKYLVRVLAIVDQVTLATGLAAEDTLEMAEDRARLRALSALIIHPTVNPVPSKNPVLSKQPSPAFADLATQPMARSGPSAGVPTPTQDKAGSAPNEETTDLPRDYSRSVISPSADQWLSSSQVDRPQPETSDRKQAIAVPPDRGSSFDSLETDPVFSPVTANVSGSPRGTATGTEIGTGSIPEFDTQTVSTTPENPNVDPGYSGDGSNFLDDQERKTKIAETTIEIQRLNWSTQQGRDFLQQRYDRRARSQLSDQQLLDFLHYLKAQPTPT